MKSLLFITLFVSQLAVAQQEIGPRTESITKSRLDLEGVLDSRSFSEEEHKIIKTYFLGLKGLESDLSLNARYVRRFNSSLRASGLEKFCSSVFLDSRRYDSLIKNCTRNGFFLCSDDVQSFSVTKKKLGEKLETDLKTDFGKFEACK